MRVRAAVVVAVCALLLGGCGGTQSASRITTKRVALELAFKGEGQSGSGKRSAERGGSVAVQPSLSAAGILPTNLARFVPRGAPTIAPEPCPKAPVGSSVERPVTVAINKPPKTGSYLYANKGKGNVQQGSVKFDFPYPPYTERAVRNVKPTSNGFTYETFERGLSSDSWTAISYQVTPTALLITKIAQHSKDGTAEINPTPAVTFMTVGRGEGATWRSAGVDTTNGTVMEIDGAISKREIIDVCGKLVDTYRVETNQRFINSVSGYSYQTDSDHPAVYNVATQYGGIVIREIIKSTAQLPTSSGPVTLRLDYTGVVQRAAPVR